MHSKLVFIHGIYDWLDSVQINKIQRQLCHTELFEFSGSLLIVIILQRKWNWWKLCQSCLSRIAEWLKVHRFRQLFLLPAAFRPHPHCPYCGLRFPAGNSGRFPGVDLPATRSRSHSEHEHRFQAPSSKSCQNVLRHWRLGHSLSPHSCPPMLSASSERSED